MVQQNPKYITGDGINAPDLKLLVGAFMSVTYWQADPGNNQQPTICIKSDNRSNRDVLTLHPSHAAELANALLFIDQQIG